jgi:DNA-damage-inducible protein J
MYSNSIEITIQEVIKMSTTKQINMKVPTNLKIQVENIFNRLGLTHSEALKLFYNQVVLNDGLPFEIKIPKEKTPNKETRKAFKDVDNNIDVNYYKDDKEFFKSFGI